MLKHYEYRTFITATEYNEGFAYGTKLYQKIVKN